MGCVSSVKVKPDNNGNDISVRSAVKKNEISSEKKNNTLRGDVISQSEARRKREEKNQEKRKMIMSAAEQISDVIMEERERLSLETRLTSRNTSRNTSRGSSPVVDTRKQVQFSTGNKSTSASKGIPTKSEPVSKSIMKVKGDNLNLKTSEMRVTSLEPNFELKTHIPPTLIISPCTPRNGSQVPVEVT